MDILEAIILGLIQGATEFLPVSSSGHLFLLPEIFGMAEPTLHTVAMAHLGTLVAVFIYFWRDIYVVAKSVLEGLAQRKPLGTADARLGWYILVGSIPAGLIGLLFEDAFDEKFGNARSAAFFLMGTALILVIGELLHNGRKPIARMTWFDAIFIGVAQVLALFPGISRSGTTITAGLLRNLDRHTAARFSFLLGIPPILGAGLLSILDFRDMTNASEQLPALIALFFAAAISGYLCIHILLSWVKKHSLYGFAVYCALFSLTYLVVSAL